jgi:hypothetical protein
MVFGQDGDWMGTGWAGTRKGKGNDKAKISQIQAEGGGGESHGSAGASPPFTRSAALRRWLRGLGPPLVRRFAWC